MLRTRLTLQPGRPGTKRLADQYGDRLVCVRYRYDDTHHRRLKTVELIVEDVPWLSRDAQSRMVDIYVEHYDYALRAEVRENGGRWQPATRTWRLRYATVLALGLESHIVPSPTPPPEPRHDP
jgi:hypothetical protein